MNLGEVVSFTDVAVCIERAIVHLGLSLDLRLCGLGAPMSKEQQPETD